ncbi:hypothetical protein SAY87_017534 [Trapa incisa]|uniref:SAM domain-containing protein n=1 Tax=Trapa incisa TaxID=236973 RepID=A0AAN7QT15_9MYRT|nr:hypothetical protein SAY87_017534 [Trapa incisa]
MCFILMDFIWEMNKGHPPEPLDFFIWTVEDVGLWLEEINLGNYREIFRENGVNGEYLESMSIFTTEQILRFIRRCHMKWGDFITLCKELRRIKVFGLFEWENEGTKNTSVNITITVAGWFFIREPSLFSGFCCFVNHSTGGTGKDEGEIVGLVPEMVMSYTFVK